MIYKATQEIYDALTAHELKASIREADDMSMVVVGFPLENSSPVRVQFISKDEGNDVAVRVLELMRVEEYKTLAVMKVLSGLNRKYRYLKFTLDDDNDINVEYDLPLNGENIGECAMELVVRFVRILREAYPEIMRAIWQ